MSGKIIQVTPEVFTREELRRYEEKILDNKSLTEREASKFFRDFPKFLTVGGYLDIAREVVLYKGDKQMYRVDFVRRKAGEGFWDFVELKDPRAPYLVKDGVNWVFSAKIEKAVHQGRRYKDFLNDERNRINLELRTGIRAYRPQLLIVGGRHNDDIDSLELRRMVDHYNNIDIKNYDDLYNFAKENYERRIIVVPSLAGHLSRPLVGQVHLRSKPLSNLSEDAAKRMLIERGFYDSRWNETGTGLQHVYEVFGTSGEKLVRDNATGLTWQQSGSDFDLGRGFSLIEAAHKFIKELNQANFAGQSDWRLPTLEEAMSLMEPKQNQAGLFIEPVFDTTQSRIWTADASSASRAWYVYFSSGYCNNHAIVNDYYVRAVR